MSKKLEFDFKPSQVKSLIELRKASAAGSIPDDVIKGLKLFSQECSESVKLFDAALDKKDLAGIDRHAYNIELMGNWILKLYLKYK
jgi:hypothetical protein